MTRGQMLRGALSGCALLALSAEANAQAAPSAYTSGTRYDVMGRVTGTIAPDPDGSGPLNYSAVRNTYDGLGRLVLVEKGELATWQADSIAPAAWTGFTVLSSVASAYDAYGHKTSDTSKGSDGTAYKIVQYSYDAHDRLTCTAVRMNPQNYATLPASACTLSTAGSFGDDRITQQTLDKFDRVTTVQKALGTSVQITEATYTYLNNSDLVTSVTDARGYTASMAYDGFGRRKDWYFPNPSTTGVASTTDYEAYTYDLNGNRTSLRKRDGRTITFTYDALNRVATKCVTTTTCAHANATTGRDVYYAYDLAGHQISAKFDSAAGPDGITNAYDGFGNLISSTTSMGAFSKAVTSQFDADDDRTQITHPDGQSFTYAYDGRDRLVGIYEGMGTSAPLDSMVWNANGMLNSRTEGAPSNPNATVSYTWDPVGRLATQSDAFPSGATGNISWTFSRNPADQIISEARNNGAYAFNGFVNLSRNYAVNGLNQYTSAGPASFTFDPNGNLTSDGTNTYIYDAENRLVSATSAGVTTNVTYDPLGRLFEVVKGSADTRFLYDGDALIAEYDGTGAIMNRYVHGSDAAADDPLVWYQGATLATKHYLHADHLGSIVAVTNSSGAPTVNSYDEYGLPQTDAATHTINLNSGRFQFTGQAWVGELGMYYYKARIYSPTLGRFLQTDPIGYKDQINLYAYVGDDPVDDVDPSGTSCLTGQEGDCGQGRHQQAAERQLEAQIPTPPSKLPGGPYTAKSDGNKPGSFQGPPQEKGPRSQSQWVPPERDGGPQGAKEGYWKVWLPGNKKPQRFTNSSNPEPITPEQAHPSSPPSSSPIRFVSTFGRWLGAIFCIALCESAANAPGRNPEPPKDPNGGW